MSCTVSNSNINYISTSLIIKYAAKDLTDVRKFAYMTQNTLTAVDYEMDEFIGRFITYDDIFNAVRTNWLYFIEKIIDKHK